MLVKWCWLHGMVVSGLHTGLKDSGRGSNMGGLYDHNWGGAFRDLKSELGFRTVFHHKKERLKKILSGLLANIAEEKDRVA